MQNKSPRYWTVILADMEKHIHDSDQYADLDPRLHLKIASATQNLMMFYLVAAVMASHFDDAINAVFLSEHHDQAR